MSIKKQYIDLHNFLVLNKNKKVSTILEELEEMMESKTRDTTSLYDKDENLVAIFCYYHKVWELVKDHDYGSKANSKTGLNTMCKLGVSKWTRQQVTLKNIESNLLEQVMNGTVKVEDVKDLKVKAEAEAREIIPTEDIISFQNIEDLSDHLDFELYTRKSTK